ncbi:MAG: hypothetical protein H6986_13325 [Pseudomonadales bacterium]|nr:hypothetical protein [Pseudomonadales bacterium]
MEIGPRALGSRSILANPTLPDMKAKINAGETPRGLPSFAPSATVECSRVFRHRCRGAVHAQGLRCQARQARVAAGNHPCRRLRQAAYGARGNQSPLP